MEFKDCKIGDLVQLIDWKNKDNDVQDCVIIELLPAKNKERPQNYWSLSDSKQKQYDDHCKVEFISGKQQVLNFTALYPRDSEIEREFRIAAKSVLVKINSQLDKANKALAEAEALSEQFGIPFASDVSRLSQAYTPQTFSEKYPDLNSDIIEQATSTYENEYSGWQHSAVCY